MVQKYNVCVEKTFTPKKQFGPKELGQLTPVEMLPRQIFVCTNIPIKDDFTREDNLKKGNNLKNKGDPKNEDNFKQKGDLKDEEYLRIGYL